MDALEALGARLTTGRLVLRTAIAAGVPAVATVVLLLLPWRALDAAMDERPGARITDRNGALIAVMPGRDGSFQWRESAAELPGGEQGARHQAGRPAVPLSSRYRSPRAGPRRRRGRRRRRGALGSLHHHDAARPDRPAAQPQHPIQAHRGVGRPPHRGEADEGPGPRPVPERGSLRAEHARRGGRGLDLFRIRPALPGPRPAPCPRGHPAQPDGLRSLCPPRRRSCVAPATRTPGSRGLRSPRGARGRCPAARSGRRWAARLTSRATSPALSSLGTVAPMDGRVAPRWTSGSTRRSRRRTVRAGPLRGGAGQNAAVVVIDNLTDGVLGWVGSRDFQDEALSRQIDGVLIRRQSASTLKPFLYATPSSMDRPRKPSCPTSPSPSVTPTRRPTGRRTSTSAATAWCASARRSPAR